MLTKKEKKKPLQTHKNKIIMHFASTLEHALKFLKFMVNEHVLMKLISLVKYCNPH